MAERLLGIAGEYGLDMTHLHLEITESAAMTLGGFCRSNLEKLRAAGAKLALDDYGTGYSSVSRISDYGMDTIKLDKSLVWSYCDGKTSNLEYLVPMFKADGKMVLAEGVETLQQVEMLTSIQCDYMQGYYYARPMPPEDFLPFLRSFSA